MDSVLQKLYKALDEVHAATEEFVSHIEAMPVGYDENDNVLGIQKALDDAKDNLGDACDAIDELEEELDYLGGEDYLED